MERNYEYDVVVVGGGSAGVAAAVSSADYGAKTLIIERNPYFGGEATHSSITSYCGFHTRGVKPIQVVMGVGEQVLNTLRKNGESTDYTISKATGNASIRFDPEKLKLSLDQILENSKADYLLHALVIGVNIDNGSIRSIECIDDEGRFIVKAKSFVDASGDANLTHMAGLKTLWGNEEGLTQMASMSVRVDHLPRNVEIFPADMEKAIIQGKADGVQHLGKEKGMLIKIPNEDYGFCTIPSLSVNRLDSQTLTIAEMELRKQSYAYVEVLRKYVPELKNMRLVSTGPQLGLRESRRIIGEDTLTYNDVLSGRKREDSIARGGWSPEIHKSTTELNYLHLEDNAYFDIPIGCIKVKDIKNVWCCGRIISCDQVAHASVRVMGTGFALGQAAGVAAACTLDNENYDVNQIRMILKQQGALV